MTRIRQMTADLIFCNGCFASKNRIKKSAVICKDLRHLRAIFNPSSEISMRRFLYKSPTAFLKTFLLTPNTA